MAPGFLVLWSCDPRFGPPTVTLSVNPPSFLYPLFSSRNSTRPESLKTKGLEDGLTGGLVVLGGEVAPDWVRLILPKGKSEAQRGWSACESAERKSLGVRSFWVREEGPRKESQVIKDSLPPPSPRNVASVVISSQRFRRGVGKSGHDSRKRIG
jgi:hypothetical protein